MFNNPSLLTRITIGKALGFIFGLAGFIILPMLVPDVAWHLKWGVLFWYVTFGAIIGVFGVVTWHPILKLPMPWWFRGPYMGAWLNLCLALVAYEPLAALMQQGLNMGGLFYSPFWIVAEGAIVGFIIDFLATKYGGEGAASADMDKP